MEHRQDGYSVSIPVVVDCLLRQHDSQGIQCSDDVSIPVVVDCLLRPTGLSRRLSVDGVSIPVVVDCLLRPKKIARDAADAEAFQSLL